MKRVVGTILVVMAGASLVPGQAALSGPTYDINGAAGGNGYTFASSGNPGRTGGLDYEFSAINLGDYSRLYYGPAPVSTTWAVGAAMDGAASTPEELMNLSLGDSDLINGIARWTGSTRVWHRTGGTWGWSNVYLRYTMRVTDLGGSALSLIDAVTEPEIDATNNGVGAVLDVTDLGVSAFRANHLFEAALTPGAWSPLLNLYDALETQGQNARTSLDTGFWYEANVIPAPGAVVLGALGCSLLGMIRRRLAA